MVEKNTKGITLIVLVITIIILLILAGVTFALLTGENGILNKSTTAKNETEKQTATEIINLKITNVQIDSYAQKQKMPTLKELSLALKEDEEIEYITESSKIASVEYNVTSDNPSKIYTKLKEYPYEFEIDGNLKLATIDGEKVDNKDADSKDDNTTDNNTTNNDEIKSKLEELDIAIKAVESENEKLKSEIAILKENKRIKLMDTPVTIPLEVTGWKDGDYANITLSDSIENYKYIEIQYNFVNSSNTNSYPLTHFIATQQLTNYNNTNNLNNSNESAFPMEVNIHQGDIDYGVWGWFKNNKLLHIGAIWNFDSRCTEMKINNIYGIK